MRSSLAFLLSVTLLACGDDGSGSSNMTPDASGGGSPDASVSMSCVPSFTPRSADQAGAEAACASFFEAMCERFFDGCDEAGGYIIGSYDTVNECKTGEGAGCTQLDLSGSYPNTADANQCVSGVQSEECSTLSSSLPDGCRTNYLPVEPAPTGCEEITPGTYDGTITGGESVSHGVAPAATYCICLSAGETVDIETAARGDMDIGDTRLALVDEGGNTIAYNDDATSGSGYSRISGFSVTETGAYLIVVSPYPYDVEIPTGDFSLSVTVR